jgi:predicted amidohydrolase
MAESIAFSVDDLRIRRLRDVAAKKDIVIVAGAPIQIDSKLLIGEFIISPDHSIQIYTKHFLHPGEEKYYQPSFDFDPVIDLSDERVAFAICADIDHPEHPEQAVAKGATVYIPSIFFSPNGIPDAYGKLGEYSKKHSLNILMSNYSGESMGMPAAGRSAFWNNHGELVGEMNSSNTGLLLIEKKNGIWTNKIINYH